MKAESIHTGPVASIDTEQLPLQVNTPHTIAAIVVGNGLELYDFTVYLFFSTTIARLFFPSENELTSLMLFFATFGASFVMRPLGAVLIGYIGDRRGRRTALSLTIGLMTVGTAMIAFAPTYDSIGVAAPILIVVARLLQGLATGAEIAAASVLLMESARRDRRCEIVSWQTASQGAAALMGALTAGALLATLSPQALADWGWRVPFVFGLLIGPVGLYIRRHLRETTIESERTQVRISNLLGREWRTLILGTMLIGSTTTTMYVMVYFMPTYLVRSLGMPAVLASLAACIAGLALLILSPLAGRLADRLRQRKCLLYATQIIFLILLFPAFEWMVTFPSAVAAITVVGASVILPAVAGGAGTALMMEAFPRRHRVMGTSIMFSFGVAIFGGFAPLIVTWLIDRTGSSMAPAWYLCASMVITLLALLAFPDRKHD